MIKPLQKFIFVYKEAIGIKKKQQKDFGLEFRRSGDVCLLTPIYLLLKLYKIIKKEMMEL